MSITLPVNSDVDPRNIPTVQKLKNLLKIWAKIQNPYLTLENIITVHYKFTHMLLYEISANPLHLT